MRSFRLESVVAAAMILVPCASAYAIEARYDCSGTQLIVQFSPPGAANGRAGLTFGTGHKIELPQVMSADGGRYANGETEFWIKGRNATLSRAGSSQNCTTK
jgi:membrane-bound inhibitor of C-type lysozyme